MSEAGDSPCTETRAIVPAKGLRSYRWDADVCSVVFENADGKLYGWDGEKQLPRPSVVIVRHTRGPNGEHWLSDDMYRKARKNGQRVYFDCDDDLWHLPPWNPATQWITPEVQSIVERNMNACDGVFVSTPALADVVAERVDVPVYVTPNGVDVAMYRPRMDEGTPLRLAWFGGTNWRRPDLELVVEPLQRVLKGRYGQVEFWHIGWQEGKESIRDILGPDFPVQIVEYPWVPIHLFPWVASMVDCAIIPQPEHEFSEARSNVTGLRLCAAGVPFAATTTAEYEKLWHLGGGYTVHNQEWEGALDMLVDPVYQEARRSLRNGGLAVARHHAPEKIAENYLKVLDER